MQHIQKTLSQNELRVLRAVFESGPVSRIKIAKGLHLTRAAVTLIVQRLQELNLIVEAGKGTSKNGPGRREVLLTVSPDAGYILSIHIALTYVTLGLVNLSGTIIKKWTHKFPLGSTPDDVLTPVIESIHNFLREEEINCQHLFGLGVALPGIVNYEAGMAIEKTLQGWEGFPLREYIQQRLDCQVIIENDVKTLTLGEFQFGTGRHVRNMVCMWLEDGIGSGIINDGRLIRGITSSAGEIGFNEFILEKPSDKTILIEGTPTCWGDILSFSNIRASIRRGLKEGWKSQLSEESDIDDFILSVEAGDPLGIYLFRLLGKIVGVVSCNLIYTFNPQVLLLSGPLFRRLPRLTDEVRTHLNKGYLRIPIEASELRTSILGEDGVTIGGAALVLESLFRAAEHRSMHS